MTTNVIDVSGLSKTFGTKTVVNNVSLQVQQKEIVGFLGPNGSGKTTTIRLLCGLLRPDRASGTCLGFDLKTQSEEIKLLTGYMTQRFSFYEDLTIQENLEFVARLYNLRPRHEVVDAALQRIGLMDRRHQLAGALSGGWKQRLALAACMLHEPKLLLLDEPTAGVDPQARREFWDAIHTLAEEGVTVLVSTHYMDEAEQLCDRLLVMDKGRIVAAGSPRELIARYVTREVLEVRMTDEVRAANAGRLATLGTHLEHLPERLQFYADDGEQVLAQIHQMGLPVERALVRRATLEDVFLRLTGRTLID